MSAYVALWACEVGGSAVFAATCTLPSLVVVLWLADGGGSLTNAGLLQVGMGNDEFGIVCGMNLEAAEGACTQWWYDFSSPCGTYGGSHLSGIMGKSMPVIMKVLQSNGEKVVIKDCRMNS